MRKTWPIRPGLQILSVNFRSQYSEARKAASEKLKVCKEKTSKEFEKRWDNDFKTANKVFWQTGSRFCEKYLKPVTSSKIQICNGVVHQAYLILKQTVLLM